MLWSRLDRGNELCHYFIFIKKPFGFNEKKIYGAAVVAKLILHSTTDCKVRDFNLAAFYF